jgi:hypothetical protein
MDLDIIPIAKYNRIRDERTDGGISDAVDGCVD